MTDITDKARSIQTEQLVTWMFLHLVSKGVISGYDAKRQLELFVEKNIVGNEVDVKVSELFNELLYAVPPVSKPKRGKAKKT